MIKALLKSNITTKRERTFNPIWCLRTLKAYNEIQGLREIIPAYEGISK